MSAEDAKEFVRMAKFAPLGLRGLGAGIDSQYGMAHIKDYVKQANEETLLVVMIEDQEVVACVDSIAAVEGIDVLFVGPADLSQSYGVTGQVGHPLVLQAMEKVSAACKKHGKTWGSVPEPGGRIEKLLDLGAQFINIVSDIRVLIDGFQAAREKVTQKPGNSRGATASSGGVGRTATLTPSGS